MAMKHLPLLLFLVTTAIATCHGSEPSIRHQIHLLRPQTGSAGRPHSGLSCLSWRLAVETHNIIDWSTVPKVCESYIGHYMLGYQYRLDSKEVVDQAITYVQSLNLTSSSKPTWVFDIDDTTLSNLPYYAKHGFGSPPYYSVSTAAIYKSSMRTKLVKEGYEIVGNMGDQWSDILGPNPGNRTFKLPDPLY